jgi:hypothetical protein
MTWLLTLYPPSWRRRYGDELRELLAKQRFSLGNTIDLISGAIDAWINPQLMAAAQAAPAVEGEKMFAKTMKFRCAGYGPEISKADQWKSVAVMLGITLFLTLGWLWYAKTSDSPYVEAFSVMPFYIGWLVSLRYTYLKGRSFAAQATFILGSLALVTAIFAAAAWISSRI